MKYCASQDRSEYIIRQKLEKELLSDSEKEAIIELLKEYDFIDDARFAEAFVRGKFRQKKWGKFKIVFHLLHHQIPKPVIDRAVSTIDDEEYRETFQYWLDQKLLKTRDKAKIYAFLTSKGFENFYILQNWNLDN